MKDIWPIPFTDIGFKIIFGQPASKELLITLLNELLAGEHHIENLTFIDKEDNSDNVNDRGIIFDLYCLTSSGEYIIVEMQNRWHSNFLDRTLYYVCRAISRLIERPITDEVELPAGGKDSVSDTVSEAPLRYGDRYKLSTVYGIFLMNFKEGKLEPKFRTDTVVADRENGRTVNPHFRQIYLQFPYFTKQLEECETLYDKLIYALKNMNEWNRMPDALKEQYDKAVDRYYVNRIYEEDMQDRVENAMREGREKGKLEDAQNLKHLGVSMDIIAKATGLSMEDIEKL